MKTFSDASLVPVRETIRAIESELDAPSDSAGVLRGLARTLIDQLAIEPPARMRACPKCGALGFPAASRCGSCWISLVPEA